MPHHQSKIACRPYGLAVDSSGNILVSEIGNDRIQKFIRDGKFVTKWGSYGCKEDQFREHHGIAIDSQDNVYVVDTQNERIQKSTSNGAFIISWGTEGMNHGQFWLPHAIAIDPSDNVYVSDSGDVHHKKPPCK